MMVSFRSSQEELKK
jgi:hypothetical protein